MEEEAEWSKFFPLNKFKMKVLNVSEWVSEAV